VEQQAIARAVSYCWSHELCYSSW